MNLIMDNYMTQKTYCEDCAFYNRYLRPGKCSAPQNLIKKKYENLVTRRGRDDGFRIRWTRIDVMRSFGWFKTRVYRVCGKEARWFRQASPAEVTARAKP